MALLVQGYALFFDETNPQLHTREDGRWYEIHARGAYDAFLNGKRENLRALLNHDADGTIGDEADGTFAVSIRKKGLWVEIVASPRHYRFGRHHSKLRWFVNGFSVGFRAYETMTGMRNGTPEKTILRASLAEISVTTGQTTPALLTTVDVQEISEIEYDLRRRVNADTFAGTGDRLHNRRRIALQRFGGVDTAQALDTMESLLEVNV